MKTVNESLYEDEHTLPKVYAAMEKSGLTHGQARDAIHAIQVEGILFREYQHTP